MMFVPPVNINAFADLNNLSYKVSHVVCSAEEAEEFRDDNRNIVVNVLTTDGYRITIYISGCD